MRKVLALCLLASVAPVSSAELPAAGPLPEAGHRTIGYNSVQEALAALKAKPSAQIRQQQGWTIISDQETENVSALWSFSPEGYPAYPAAVKRITYEKDGGVYIEMKVLCQAAKESCDALVRDFQALNDRIKAEPAVK
jgi:hypothetical protein